MAAITAIVVETASKLAVARGVVALSRVPAARAAGASSTELASLRHQSATDVAWAGTLSLIGFGLAGAAVVCLVAAFIKNESRGRMVPVLLLATYVMWLMLLV